MNCKTGDLAIVMSAAPVHSDAIGRIVEVGQLSQFECGRGPEWEIEFVGKRPVSFSSWSGVILGADVWLRPVSGLPLGEEVPSHIKEPA